MTSRAFWQTVTRFDHSRIHPWMALRNALGVALPLAVGAAIGQAAGGLIMSTGALNVAFSDGTDPYAHRARRMLAASFCCGVAVFAGALTGRLHVLAIPEAAICAYVAGMMVAVSTPAADIGTVTLIVLVAFSAQDMSPQHALIAGLPALGGGLLQAILALALWPLRPYRPERWVPAALFQELAHTALKVGSPTEAPAGTAAMSAAQTALQSLSGDRSLEAERYLALLSQAERIRIALLALGGLRTRIGAEAAELARTLTLASEVLAAIGASLEAGTPTAVRPQAARELHQLAEQMRHRDAHWQIAALTGQLRSAIGLAGHVTPAGVMEFERQEAAQLWRLRLAGTVALLRANLRLDSATFRHALRLAVCVVFGTLAGDVLDWRRSYWLPMTIASYSSPISPAPLAGACCAWEARWPGWCWRRGCSISWRPAARQKWR